MDEWVQRLVSDHKMRDYWRHASEFPLTHLSDDTHLERAIAKVDALLDQECLSPGDARYLDAISDLIAVYEDEHVDLPRVGGVAVLRHLMEAHGLQQKDLVPLLGSKSTISEVLHGKRRLGLTHIQRLSSYFHVPADVFMERDAAIPVSLSPP